MIAQGGTELDLMADCTGHARAALAARRTEPRSPARRRASRRRSIPARARPCPTARCSRARAAARRAGHCRHRLQPWRLSRRKRRHARVWATSVPSSASVMQAMADANRATRRGAVARPAVRGGQRRRARADSRRRAAATRFVTASATAWASRGTRRPGSPPATPRPAAPGMVFSCEPGVYRPGRDGWRTIETLIVGDGAVEVASRFQSDASDRRTRVLPV